MPLKWFTPDDVESQIRHFPPFLKQKVREAMDEIALCPCCGKALTEDLAGLYSFRIGKYRLVYHYQTHSERLTLIAIGPRRDIYQKIAIELGRMKIRERAERYAARRYRLKRKEMVSRLR